MVNISISVAVEGYQDTNEGWFDNCGYLMNEQQNIVSEHDSTWFTKLRRTKKIIKVRKIVQKIT